MRNLRYIARAAMQKIITVRVLTFSVIMLLMNWNFNEPLRRFSTEMEYPSSIWVFPFMLAQFTYLIMFFLAVIYANADIPFMQHSSMYSIIRTGRRKWGITQLCIIFLRSFVLVMITFFCSFITLLPKIELTTGWGNLIKTIAMGHMQVNYEFNYDFYYEAMIKFTPLGLLCLTILVTTLVVTLLVNLMFLVSLYVDRVISVSGAAGFIFLMFFVLNMHPKIRYILAKFIPTIWPEVARINTPDYGYYWLPSVKYMIVFLGITVILLSIMVVRRIRHIEFNWENEDE